MHGSAARSRGLTRALIAGIDPASRARMLLCPPFPYLSVVAAEIDGTGIELGGQDVCDQTGAGAFTGEVSGEMLADVGCRYAIVGHSERRALYAEDDARVAAKFRAAQAAGLIPIVCVGETLEQREADATRTVVERQVTAVLDAAGAAAFRSAVIAYEPVWAIGTGRTATPEQAQEVHALIRAMIGKRDATIAAELRILYGGSVKAANAAELFAMDDIDGGLVGGASLEASEFLKIFAAA